MRRGAASCRAVLGSCPVVAAVRAAAPVPSPRSRDGWPSAPRCRDPARSGRPAGVAGREDVRTPARPVVALSASSGPPWDVRPTGRADIRCPGVRCPGVRCPRVRCPVPSRCPDGPASGVRGAAAALSARWIWSGSVWRATPVGRSGSTCPRGLPAAWSPACIGPDGKGRGGGCRCLLAGGSTLAQGRRLAGVPAAAPPGRRADTGAGPGQGAGRVAREAWDRAAAHRPAGRPGQVAGVVPDHGPGPGGGDHTGWSLGEG